MALIMVVKTPPVAVVPVIPLVQPSADPTAVETLVSESIELHRKFVYFEFKSLTKRMDDLRKQLQSIANETMDETKPAIFTSPEGEIEFSERTKVAEVTAPLELLHDLLEKFGPAATASVIDVAITPLRKLLSEFELKHYLIEKPGGRTLRAVRKV